MSFLVGPDEGHQLGGAFDVVVRVRAEQTNGVMAVIEETTLAAPGAWALKPRRILHAMWNSEARLPWLQELQNRYGL